MSVINEALQRASNEKDQKVIPVPRVAPRHPWLFVSAFLLLFALVGFLGFRLWNETRLRASSEAALSQQMKDLEERHADLVSRIYQSDAHLDTRLQLEVFDLKADLRRLSARLDALNPEELQSLKSETQLFRDQTKEDLRILSKRFHNNEREHVILNDRIEALKARLDDAPAS